MGHVRSATRWVSIAVAINILVGLVVAIGLVTGANLLLNLFGGDGPVAQKEETITTLASVAVMVLLALLGIGPSLICNFVGGCLLCHSNAPAATRQWSIGSLLLFSLAILLIIVVGWIPSEDFPGLRRTLRIIALVLALGSHVSFLAALRRITAEQLGLFMEPLFWSTLGLCAASCLLVGLTWLGWFPVYSMLGFFTLGGIYLAWNGCYLAVLWQVGSRT